MMTNTLDLISRIFLSLVFLVNGYSKINNIEGLSLWNPPDYADNNHWLNLLQIDKKVYNEDREVLMKRLEENGIQTRPVWKLNHEQKPYKDCQYYKVKNVNKLLENSLCLPSSSSLSVSQIKMVGKYLKWLLIYTKKCF